MASWTNQEKPRQMWFDLWVQTRNINIRNRNNYSKAIFRLPTSVSHFFPRLASGRFIHQYCVYSSQLPHTNCTFIQATLTSHYFLKNSVWRQIFDFCFSRRNLALSPTHIFSNTLNVNYKRLLSIRKTWTFKTGNTQQPPFEFSHFCASLTYTNHLPITRLNIMLSPPFYCSKWPYFQHRFVFLEYPLSDTQTWDSAYPIWPLKSQYKLHVWTAMRVRKWIMPRSVFAFSSLYSEQTAIISL
jgi:hypothetical protein